MANQTRMPKFQVGEDVLMIDPDLPYLGFQTRRVLEVIEKDDGYYYVTVLKQDGQTLEESKMFKMPDASEMTNFNLDWVGSH